MPFVEVGLIYLNLASVNIGSVGIDRITESPNEWTTQQGCLT